MLECINIAKNTLRNDRRANDDDYRQAAGRMREVLVDAESTARLLEQLPH